MEETPVQRNFQETTRSRAPARDDSEHTPKIKGTHIYVAPANANQKQKFNQSQVSAVVIGLHHRPRSFDYSWEH